MSDFAIGRRQLYILPTRIGWYYAMILFALFAIAIKYNNQAAFMMLFLLVAVGIIAMHYTHNNVIGLKISSSIASPVFVGEQALFPVQIKNHSDKSRHAVWLICAGFRQVLNLASNDQIEITVKLPTLKRGYHTCPEMVLSSQFPMGIFFCWSKRFQTSKRCVVYPQPLNLISFPDSGEGNSKSNTKSVVQNNFSDYSGMKAYQPGDRPRDIHWPSLAKTHKLITIQHNDQPSSSVNLSWFSLPKRMSTEDRLSQLCFWLIDAEKSKQRYQLEMPNHTIQFNNGSAHLNECLTVLALWEIE